MSYDWLPPLLAEIAEVAGLDAALALAEARGGSRITIPARPRPDHWFAQTVGMEAAEKIAAFYRVGGKRHERCCGHRARRSIRCPGRHAAKD